MRLRISPAAVGRPVEDVDRVHEQLTARRREHRETWGRWAPEDADTMRWNGMLTALYWLTGEEPCGPFRDGPAGSVERVRSEAAAARQVAEAADPASRRAAEAGGVADLLEYACGQVDELRGFVEAEHRRAA